MKRERLTPDRIRRFCCPPDKQQVFLWDTEAPRLAVRATSGAKSFVFETKLNRRTIRRTIGDVRAWNLDDARAEARRLQTLTDKGVDPRELDREEAQAREVAERAKEAEQKEAEERRRYTLSALCQTYTEHLRTVGKVRSGAAAASLFRCHLSEEAAASPARDLTSLQVAAMVRRVREAGKERAAGVLRSYLSAAFNAAKRAPFDAALPAELIAFGIEHNPVDAIPAIPVKRGHRKLSVAELRAYIGHLLRIGRADATGLELPDQALRLALYAGGQRVAQLLRAKISDFDPETGMLRLWDPKGRRTQAREHLLPLGPMAVVLVAGLVERANANAPAGGSEKNAMPELVSRWLFSTHGRVPMTLETVCNRVAEISAQMGGVPFTVRDVRRTAETMLAELRVSKDTRAQLLSHGISGVQAAHYDRHSYVPEKNAALRTWERRLRSIQLAERVPAQKRRLTRARL